MLLLFSLKNNSGDKQLQYQKVSIARGDIQVTIAATGEVGPRTRLELKPPIAGRIERINVNEGDKVKKGDVIGYLSSAERVALIDTARANGAKELEEWKKLYKAIPLVVPIDGMVIARSVEPGQSVESSESIITLSDKLIIQVQVDETDIAKISKGQQVNIILDAYPNKRIKGVTDHIAFDATISENIRVYKVNIIPQNAPVYMKSGMGVEAIFNTDQKTNIIIVPRTSLQYDTHGAYLYKKDQAEIMKKKYLKLGVQSGDKVEVVSGVTIKSQLFYPKTSFNSEKNTEEISPLIAKPPERPRPPGHKRSSNKKEK